MKNFSEKTCFSILVIIYAETSKMSHFAISSRKLTTLMHIPEWNILLKYSSKCCLSTGHDKNHKSEIAQNYFWRTLGSPRPTVYGAPSVRLQIPSNSHHSVHEICFYSDENHFVMTQFYFVYENYFLSHEINFVETKCYFVHKIHFVPYEMKFDLTKWRTKYPMVNSV